MSWPLIKLKDICDLQNGYAFKSSDYVDSSNTLSCRMSNIRPGGVFNIDYNARYLPDDFSKKYEQFLLNDGDVIIAMTDLADAPKILGVPTVVQTGGKSVLLNQRVGKLVIKDSDRVHFPYLKLALNYPKVRSVYKRFAGGGLQINLGKNDLLNVEIPLPPLDEQKRIAAILDKADAIRRKRQQAIQLADDFLRSVFLDMFGDPVTNPKGWPKNQLQEVCNKVIDCPHSTPKWTEEGIIGLRTSNLTKGDWNWNDKKFVSEATYKDRSKRAELEENDIILSREGTVGIAALVPANIKMCMGQRLVQLKANKKLICPEFLLFFLLYELEPERISRVMAGSTSKHLNVKDLKSLEVFIPPLSQQEKFASIFRHKKIVETKFRSSTHQEELNFKSLSQKAFAGEL